MAKLIFFNAITFCTAMNNATEFNDLNDELIAFQHMADKETKGQRKKDHDAVLVARLLPGINIGRWRKICRDKLSGRWCALSVGPSLFSEPDYSEKSDEGALHLAHMLLNEMVIDQIQRELLRLSRTGGELAIVEVTLRNRETLYKQLSQKAFDALDAGLVTCLTQIREECDSLGNTGPGRYVLLLPGVGMLHARLMAEDVQKNFMALAKQLCQLPTDCQTEPPSCAVSIVCTDPHTHSTPAALLQQCEQALGDALSQGQGHISIAGGEALDKRSSLVHSSEKRFLFFGSN
ncbi:MAG: GGDEF domain-containing protein [Desulfovibrio sp.]|nr:GGDEF domain-containing protein [Desulfovibrio sp.]